MQNPNPKDSFSRHHLHSTHVSDADQVTIYCYRHHERQGPSETGLGVVHGKVWATNEQNITGEISWGGVPSIEERSHRASPSIKARHLRSLHVVPLPSMADSHRHLPLLVVDAVILVAIVFQPRLAITAYAALMSLWLLLSVPRDDYACISQG
ncbi:unnamed protein product [Lactuca saligna]|uniref:Uncharacterized protein n=1 Tax=Lactuca saligna TaxID=75948 RepID=A0AA35YR65_LACSI|nr:unnamed protein product [Lactuca saligna]